MIALSMIVAGHEDSQDVLRCLNSVHGQVDNSYVLITSKMKNKNLKHDIEASGAVVEYKPNQFFHTITKKEVEFIKSLGLTPSIKEGDKIFEFDKARNYSMAMVPKEYEWMLWLDADDIFRGRNLKQVVKDAEERKADSIFINYIYQAEIEGGKIKNILIEHLRERIIRNTGIYKWIAPIHETLVEQKPTRKIEEKKCDVLHLSSHERMLGAIDRNIKTLEYSVADKEGKDPRPTYYLAKAHFDMWLEKRGDNHIKEAKILFETYLSGPNPSGWAEERSQCWEYLVEIYRASGEVNNAIKAAHNAMIEDERFPSIYINLALCYLAKQEYKRALWWVKQALRMDQPETTLVSTPKDLMGRSFEVIYHASLNLSKLDDAFAAAVKLKEIYPNRKDMDERYQFTAKLKEQRDITKTFMELASYLEQTGQATKLEPLLMSAPNIIKDNPFIVELEKKITPARTWGKDEICLYCGPAFTKWSPKMLENPGQSFVGGSEEAVIYLAKELVKQGWKVTVYADPANDEGEYDGVNYLPYFKFNTKDEFNIMISWRRPDLVDQDFKAKKTYIWCHDIINQLDYTPERLSKITKIIVLSPWHRSNMPDVPDNKVMLSGNGISL